MIWPARIYVLDALVVACKIRQPWQLPGLVSMSTVKGSAIALSAIFAA